MLAIVRLTKEDLDLLDIALTDLGGKDEPDSPYKEIYTKIAQARLELSITTQRRIS